MQVHSFELEVSPHVLHLQFEKIDTGLDGERLCLEALGTLWAIQKVKFLVLRLVYGVTWLHCPIFILA